MRFYEVLLPMWDKETHCKLIVKRDLPKDNS